MAGIIRVVDILKVPAEFATIQEAIDTANPGGLVSIAPGTYPEIGLVVSVDDISIEGGLDAKGQPAVVLGPEPGTIIIDDCWFGTNTASSLGGALFLDGSTASVGDSMFCTNTPDQISGDWVDEGGVAFRDDCPVYDRVTHFVSGSNGTFSPQILRVEPGDTVFWWVDVTSGEPCTPDGLFEFTASRARPPGRRRSGRFL